MESLMDNRGTGKAGRTLENLDVARKETEPSFATEFDDVISESDSKDGLGSSGGRASVRAHVNFQQ